jgi:hypothetical protein
MTLACHRVLQRESRVQLNVFFMHPFVSIALQLQAISCSTPHRAAARTCGAPTNTVTKIVQKLQLGKGVGELRLQGWPVHVRCVWLQHKALQCRQAVHTDVAFSLPLESIHAPSG